ncbi:MAG TPA: hypothetical protein VFQ85_01700 [Mycobacteriales bacterium]|jgi:hypothetical protein|nr:hypothetical protein [Mycobacteriales bacterium]
MSVSPETDPDGVDRPTDSDVHENVRDSAEGVEEAPVSGAGAEPSPGIIGNGGMTDPRYIAQR